MLLDDDDEEALERDESPAKPAPRTGGARGRRALVQDSSDDEMADAQPPPATGTAAGEPLLHLCNLVSGGKRACHLSKRICHAWPCVVTKLQLTQPTGRLRAQCSMLLTLINMRCRHDADRTAVFQGYLQGNATQSQPRMPVVVLAGEGDEIDVDLDMDPGDAELKPAEAQNKAKVCCLCCVRTQA